MHCLVHALQVFATFLHHIRDHAVTLEAERSIKSIHLCDSQLQHHELCCRTPRCHPASSRCPIEQRRKQNEVKRLLPNSAREFVGALGEEAGACPIRCGLTNAAMVFVVSTARAIFIPCPWTHTVMCLLLCKYLLQCQESIVTPQEAGTRPPALRTAQAFLVCNAVSAQASNRETVCRSPVNFTSHSEPYITEALQLLISSHTREIPCTPSLTCHDTATPKQACDARTHDGCCSPRTARTVVHTSVGSSGLIT